MKYLALLYLMIPFVSVAQIFKLPINDTPFRYRFGLPNNTYHKFCKNVHSQNGENGIIEKLLEELGIEGGTFCEFGASDGITGSNTYQLIKNHGFSGMAIESDPKRYSQCVQNYKNFPNVQVLKGLVIYNDSDNDLDAWLKRGNLPYDLDVLSIDIDGDDYYVWENLTEFKPKIVIFEVNSYRDPLCEELPKNPSTEYEIDFLKIWCSRRIGVGCSFISAVKLGLKKGYIPVSFTGNLIFVRKDLINQLTTFPFKISDDPYDYITLYTHLVLWNNQWMTNTGLILNVAMRDYYLKFGKKDVDINWINKRISQILNNQDVIF